MLGLFRLCLNAICIEWDGLHPHWSPITPTTQTNKQYIILYLNICVLYTNVRHWHLMPRQLHSQEPPGLLGCRWAQEPLEIVTTIAIVWKICPTTGWLRSVADVGMVVVGPGVALVLGVEVVRALDLERVEGVHGKLILSVLLQFIACSFVWCVPRFRMFHY